MHIADVNVLSLAMNSNIQFFLPIAYALNDIL